MGIVRLKRSAVRLALAALVVVPILVPAAAGAVEATPRPAGGADRLVVRLADEADAAERAAVAAGLGGTAVAVLAPDTIVVEGASAPDAVAAGAGDAPAIVWTEPDVVHRAAQVPDDECFTGCPASPAGQPELAAVGAPGAWDVTTGSSEVVVAVLDTPVDASHPDLVGKVEVGQSFIDPNRTCFDPDIADHGTAVAGIVGAATDNGTGISSVGWDTQVLAIAVLDNCGTGYISEIAAGIDHAVAAGADVINLSLVGVRSAFLQEAVDAARAAGVLVVAAAGNEGGSGQQFPAGYASVLGVGSATNAGTAVSTFSNYGAWVDVFAPGEDVLTLSPGAGYGTRTGTSFSAPMVAASAALVLAHRPDLDAVDLERRLAWSSGPIDGGGHPVGWGRLDAARMLVDPPASYRLTSSGGDVTAFGEAPDRGSARTASLAAPIVGSATTSDAGGYWLAGSDGGIFSFGDARFFGSMGGRPLNRPIVGVAATPTGGGYWLVASDGGIFSFGDARFFGSMGGRPLNRPIVGVAATPTGGGYWLVASDGGIFSFGDARFLGSMGGRPLQAPVVAMASSPNGGGYWMAAADGGIFTFGTAGFRGSGSGAVASPVADLAVTRRGDGYWLVTRDGQVLTFGNAIDAGGLRSVSGVTVVGIDAAS